MGMGSGARHSPFPAHTIVSGATRRCRNSRRWCTGSRLRNRRRRLPWIRMRRLPPNSQPSGRSTPGILEERRILICPTCSRYHPSRIRPHLRRQPGIGRLSSCRSRRMRTRCRTIARLIPQSYRPGTARTRSVPPGPDRCPGRREHRRFHRPSSFPGRRGRTPRIRSAQTPDRRPGPRIGHWSHRRSPGRCRRCIRSSECAR
jgi:hypothetical protein